MDLAEGATREHDIPTSSRAVQGLLDLMPDRANLEKVGLMRATGNADNVVVKSWSMLELSIWVHGHARILAHEVMDISQQTGRIVILIFISRSGLRIDLNLAATEHVGSHCEDFVVVYIVRQRLNVDGGLELDNGLILLSALISFLGPSGFMIWLTESDADGFRSCVGSSWKSWRVISTEE